MMMVAFVSAQLNVEMLQICLYHHIIAYQNLFLIVNDVLNHPAINTDGTSLHGHKYLSIISPSISELFDLISYLCLFQCDCKLRQRRRNVTCVHLNQQVSDRHCFHEPKPDETIQCYKECLAPYWDTYAWEPVSI